VNTPVKRPELAKRNTASGVPNPKFSVSGPRHELDAVRRKGNTSNSFAAKVKASPEDGVAQYSLITPSNFNRISPILRNSSGPNRFLDKPLPFG
jgi:hypothetical protein